MSAKPSNTSISTGDMVAIPLPVGSRILFLGMLLPSLLPSLLTSTCVREKPLIKPFTVATDEATVFDPDALTRIQIGMTKDEVTEILGSPLLIETDGQWAFFIYDVGPERQPELKEEKVVARAFFL